MRRAQKERLEKRKAKEQAQNNPPRGRERLRFDLSAAVAYENNQRIEKEKKG